jgi:hypothetical protein
MRPATEWQDCRNRSQANQDIFVLTCLKWKRGGTFVEIGAADPILSSNTALLVDEFGWTGTAIELNKDYGPKWAQRRPNDLFLGFNALELNWNGFLTSRKRFDYLSLDIDPPEATLAVLESLPLHQVRFSVITYEHDVWRGDDWPRKRSREILLSYGYKLAVPDVKAHVFWPYMGTEPQPFEDFYIDPQTVSF